MTHSIEAPPLDTLDDVIQYVSSGEHAFVGSDDSSKREVLASRMKLVLNSEPFECIDASRISDTADFASVFERSCKRLLKAVRRRPSRRHQTMHGLFEDVARQYSAADRQAFLFINHIDSVIQAQHTFEIEGALRTVMQFNRDVATVLCGSNQIINKIGQSDRPFYLSFRVFRV